jgi:hypothetical protein
VSDRIGYRGGVGVFTSADPGSDPAANVGLESAVRVVQRPVAGRRGPPDIGRLRDAVFLGYLHGKAPPPTAMAAPSALRRFFASVGVLPTPSGLKPAPRSWRHRLTTALRGSFLARPATAAVAIALATALGTGAALRRTLTREGPGVAPPTVFELAFMGPNGWMTTYGDTVQIWDRRGASRSSAHASWGVRRIRFDDGQNCENETIGEVIESQCTDGIHGEKHRTIRLAGNRAELEFLDDQGRVAGTSSLLRGFDPTRIDVDSERGLALVADHLLTKVDLDRFAAEPWGQPASLTTTGRSIATNPMAPGAARASRCPWLNCAPVRGRLDSEAARVGDAAGAS